MDYTTLKNLYLEVLKTLNDYLSTNKQLENTYYITRARSILKNRLNVYLDYVDFKEIADFFRPLLDKNLTVLDLGCGLGDKTAVIKKLFTSSKVYGLETTTNDEFYHKQEPPYKVFEKIYPKMAETYKLDLGLYDGYNLAFPDNSFDIVFLYAVIEHISPENRRKFIDGVSKKLRREGYLVITRCPRYYSLTEFIARKFNLGAHQWVLKRQDLLSLFDKELFDMLVFKRLGNVPTNPAKIMNKLASILICLDRLLTFIKWPFSSDYFLIVKKR